MTGRLLTLAVALLAVACGVRYDPPPELVRTNLRAGQYDPGSPLELELSEPVAEETLRVHLYTGRTGTEADLCVAGANGRLPEGCTEEVVEVVGPDDAAVSLDDARTLVTIDAADRLERFGLYSVVLDAGLEDDAGRPRRVPIEVRLQVEGVYEAAPTDWQPGMFFGRLEVEKPMQTKVHFFFWIAVDEPTGRTRLWGCDADPPAGLIEGETTDITPDQWFPEPGGEDGYPFETHGQVADTAQGRIIVFFPFDLVTTKPVVTIQQGEFTGLIYPEESVENGFSGMLSATKGPSGPREVVKGQIAAPASYLGALPDAVLLGPGQGPFAFYRMNEDEWLPLADILPDGVDEDEVRSYVFPTPE